MEEDTARDTYAAAHEAKLEARRRSDHAIDTLRNSLADVKDAIDAYHAAERERLVVAGKTHRTATLLTATLLKQSLGYRHAPLATELARFAAHMNIGARTPIEERQNARYDATRPPNNPWKSVKKSAHVQKGQLLQARDDASSWYVRVYLGTEGKKRRYFGRTVHGTQADAEEVLVMLLGQASIGQLKSRSRLTMIEFIREWWLPEKADAITPKTLKTYRWLCETYIIPALGHLTISSVTTYRIGRFLASLKGGRYTDAPLSDSTVNQTHTVLNQIMAEAVHLNFVPFNPVRDARR